MSVAFNVLLTVPSSQLNGSRTSLYQGDMFFYSIFLIESCTRILVAPSLREFLSSAMSWVDLLGWLPFFISLTVPATNTNFLGFLLCLVPFLRLVKLCRVSHDGDILIIALRLSSRQLIIPLSLLLLSALFYGGVLFFVENALQSEYGGPVSYLSMLDSVYYAIATMTTVGFGGQAPQSGLGRLFAAIMMISSVMYVAIACVILGVNFDEVYKNRYRYLAMEKMRNRMDYKRITIPSIREQFDYVDLDKSGKIDIKEFENLMNTEFRLGIPQYDIVILFTKISGEDQLTEFDEFCEFFFPEKTFHMRLKSFDIPAKQKAISYIPSEDAKVPEKDDKPVTFSTSADCVKFLMNQMETMNGQMKIMRPAIKALAAEYQSTN